MAMHVCVNDDHTIPEFEGIPSEGAAQILLGVFGEISNWRFLYLYIKLNNNIKKTLNRYQKRTLVLLTINIVSSEISKMP